MNQLTEQSLTSNNLPTMGALNQNYNLINQVPMPQLLQNQSNMLTNTSKINQKQSKSQNGNILPSK